MLHVVAIDIETTDLLVEIEKLRFGDPTGIERVQPILYADVVVRGARKPGSGIATERIYVGVPIVTARTTAIRDRVIPKLCRHHVGETRSGVLPSIGEIVPAVLAGRPGALSAKCISVD